MLDNIIQKPSSKDCYDDNRKTILVDALLIDEKMIMDSTTTSLEHEKKTIIEKTITIMDLCVLSQFLFRAHDDLIDIALVENLIWFLKELSV